LDCYLEKSKKKGFHVWMFTDSRGVPAVKARAVARYILDEAGHDAEIFPKQDVIDPARGDYGNFVNLPLFARLARQGRAVFVDPENGMKPFPNQWECLERMKLVSEAMIDEMIQENGIKVGASRPQEKSHSLGTFEAPWALPPCARRMLEEGVCDNQRVACFRLAVQLRRIGLPADIAAAALQEWATKNRPQNDKRIITIDEIRDQTASAFMKEYRGCGCDDEAVRPFCDASCRIYHSVSEARSRSA